MFFRWAKLVHRTFHRTENEIYWKTAGAEMMQGKDNRQTYYVRKIVKFTLQYTIIKKDCTETQLFGNMIRNKYLSFSQVGNRAITLFINHISRL